MSGIIYRQQQESAGRPPWRYKRTINELLKSLHLADMITEGGLSVFTRYFLKFVAIDATDDIGGGDCKLYQDKTMPTIPVQDARYCA